jgi:lipoprotein-anchoring transpeptidase ErfK/SrfK
MPSKTITLSIAATVLVVAIAAVFIVDASRSDRVAGGVRIAGIDLGGKSSAQARQMLRDRLLEPLSRPLVVRAAGRDFTLSARTAHIEANIDAMVDRAVARGRSGGVLARTWRAIGGGEVKADLAPVVGYSAAAVRRFVDRVRDRVSRRPVNAAVDFGPETVSIRRSRIGLTIDAQRLRANVTKALTTDVGERTIAAPVTRIMPKVSGSQLARRYPVVLTVDRGGFKISLFKRLERVQTYPIAVGQAGLETPAGLYKIQNKAVDPAWHVPNSAWAGSLAGTVIPGGAPNNPIKARWLGVADGVGVHGTDAVGSIGSNASHGCIRMLIADVEKLYDEVPVGTPIYIH